MISITRNISPDLGTSRRQGTLVSSRPCRARKTPVRAAAAVQDTTTASATTLSLGLKEWAVTCAALGQGDQTVILRKGGIREPTFKAPARAFLLFPTSFHSKADLLTPQANNIYQQELETEPKEQAELSICHLATVTGCWKTFDPTVLAALSEHHVWTEQFLDSRLRWRPKQPITVMELRCQKLQRPLIVPNQESYWGCFSWVDIAKGIDSAAVQSADTVLRDAEFDDRQGRVREALSSLKDCIDILKELPGSMI